MTVTKRVCINLQSPFLAPYYDDDDDDDDNHYW